MRELRGKWDKSSIMVIVESLLEDDGRSVATILLSSKVIGVLCKMSGGSRESVIISPGDIHFGWVNFFKYR